MIYACADSGVEPATYVVRRWKKGRALPDPPDAFARLCTMHLLVRMASLSWGEYARVEVVSVDDPRAPDTAPPEATAAEREVARARERFPYDLGGVEGALAWHRAHPEMGTTA